MTRAWTKEETKKVLDQLLAQGCGRSKKVWRKAGLSDTRTLKQVQELEQALTMLIYRAGGIHKAKSSISEKATQMLLRADEDIPYEVMVNSTGSVEAGARSYLAKQEMLALDQLDPSAKRLAVGAGSQLITPAIRQELPLCVHKALLCDSHITLLKAEGKVFMKQLQQRAALADLLGAAGSGDATAKSRLSALTMVMKEGRLHWMFPWWGPEDNHALLLYYHRHGVYLYRQNRVALQAWARDLLEASNIRIEFTVQVEFKLFAPYDTAYHSPKADKEPKQEEIPDHTTASLVAEIKISHAVLCRVTRPLLHVQATVVYGEEQQKRFKAFLINQLTDLMEGLTNPAVIQDSEQERAFLKERNMLCMRSPRKEVSSGVSTGEACGRGNDAVKRSSDSATRSSEPGAAAHTGPDGHADVLCSFSKRARTDDVQPPQYPVVGQWKPTDIVNLLPQCTSDKSAVLRPPARLTACGVSHAQPAASLPLWLEQVRGVQEQQEQGAIEASVAQGGHRLAVPLLAAHVMQLPQQSLAASTAHSSQPELLPPQQQPQWTPAMLQHQPYQASAVLGQQPLHPCQQQNGRAFLTGAAIAVGPERVLACYF
ncbi:MAG: hypothetical protein FRX49_00416 [Trebouxia sp. A1-2]|nr:MAG: hypothetical protein FRX49_00416 [Trebouxia sp. A1-2]